MCDKCIVEICLINKIVQNLYFDFESIFTKQFYQMAMCNVNQQITNQDYRNDLKTGTAVQFYISFHNSAHSTIVIHST